MLKELPFLGVVLLMATTTILLISQRWRWYVIALSVQYLVLFAMVSLTWPVGLAAVKLVVGWMVTAVLGASQAPREILYKHYGGVPGAVFRFLCAVMIWILGFSISPLISRLVPAELTVLWAGIITMGMGLLHMGMTTRPLRVIIGLLTMLSGFELLYASVESSVLVAGLLALINLGLALAGSYFTSSNFLEEYVA